MWHFFFLFLSAGAVNAFIPVADTKCNITQTSTCPVTIQGSAYIQLMNNASSYQVRCKKQLSSGSINVFHLKKDIVKIQEALGNRAEFFINNGTLKITNAWWNDSGQYIAEVFDSNGIRFKEITLELDVKENLWTILIPVLAALVALVILVICCCVCRRVKRLKKADSPTCTSLWMKSP